MIIEDDVLSRILVDLLGEMLLQEEECCLQQKLYSMNMERAYLDRDSSSRYQKMSSFQFSERLLACQDTQSLFFRVLEMWVLGRQS